MVVECFLRRVADLQPENARVKKTLPYVKFFRTAQGFFFSDYFFFMCRVKLMNKISIKAFTQSNCYFFASNQLKFFFILKTCVNKGKNISLPPSDSRKNLAIKISQDLKRIL